MDVTPSAYISRVLLGRANAFQNEVSATVGCTLIWSGPTWYRTIAQYGSQFSPNPQQPFPDSRPPLSYGEAAINSTDCHYSANKIFAPEERFWDKICHLRGRTRVRRQVIWFWEGSIYIILASRKSGMEATAVYACKDISWTNDRERWRPVVPVQFARQVKPQRVLGRT